MEIVKAWAAPVTLPTYEPHAPDKNPMFLETRVYQGSSGKVYPLPFIDRIATEPHDRDWQALYIENEFLRVMVLPEIGGRIHAGLDKTNGYDFFYRQTRDQAGAGGPCRTVDLGWRGIQLAAAPQAGDFHAGELQDRRACRWLAHDLVERSRSDEPAARHAWRVPPSGPRLFRNQGPALQPHAVPQTFLWWANAGVHVNDEYQSFFPPDVHFVADHARRAMSTYPLCEGRYYGVDYGRRGYPENDLSRYANIPVPTSYMAIGSNGEFSGRLRSCQAGGSRARGESSHCARQEAMDVGQ